MGLAGDIGGGFMKWGVDWALFVARFGLKLVVFLNISKLAWYGFTSKSPRLYHGFTPLLKCVLFCVGWGLVFFFRMIGACLFFL